MTNREELSIIGNNSTVRLGLVLAALAAIGTGGIWIGKRVERERYDGEWRDSIQLQVSALSAKIDALSDLVEQRTRSRWSLDQMRKWVEIAAERNPDLNWPDPDYVPNLVPRLDGD